MSSLPRVDATDITHLVHALMRFCRAFEHWLETQRVRPDHSRSGRRATVSPLPTYDPMEVALRFDQVRALEDDANRGMRLAAVVMPIYEVPGLTAAKSWSGMSTAGTRTNPEDVVSAANRAAATLQHVLKRSDRGLPLFPVPDPTDLHPFVWNPHVLSAWIQERYDRIPREIADGVRYAWGRRLGKDFKNDSTAWAPILSEISARSRSAQLHTATGTNKLSAPMADLLSTLMHLDEGGRAQTIIGALGPDAIGKWLRSWSDLAAKLELNASVAVSDPPSSVTFGTSPESGGRPARVDPSKLARVTVDLDVFAPIPHPDVPDVLVRANELATVNSEDPRRRVVGALMAAARRLQLVDELGTEHADHDSLIKEAGELHTPSWASVLQGDDAVPRLYVDCEGVITTEMGKTMRRVLQEELARHLNGAHVSSGSDSRG